MLLNEYYGGQNKQGFLRIPIDSAYTERGCASSICEYLFSGYDMRFLGAYYPDVNTVYAYGVDQTDQKSYLIFYNWGDNLRAQIWEIKVHSEDPGNASYAGLAPLDVLLFDKNYVT